MKKIDSAHIPDALLFAQQVELTANQPNEVLEGLVNVITPEAIEAGVGIEFGSNRLALQKAIDALGLESGLADGDTPIQVRQATSTEGRARSFIGSSATPELAELSLLERLDALQAIHWGVSGDFSPVRATGERVTSKLLILNSTLNGDNKVVGDLRKPGLVVGVSYIYNPSYTQEEHLEHYLTEDVAVRNGVVRTIARELHESGRSLRMPGPDYFLRIGMPVITFHTFSHSDVAVHQGEEYVFRDGQFSHLPSDEGESEE